MNAEQVIDWAENIVAAAEAGLVTLWRGNSVAMADAEEISAILLYRIIVRGDPQ